VSHCGNYVLDLGGQRLTANTRWGATALPRDVFWGPDPTFDFITSLADEDDHLYDELMCEGAALVDADRTRLLVWGGEDIAYEKPLQSAYLDLLRLNWPGWRVDWAVGGWAQVATEAGVDVGPDLAGYLAVLRHAWSWGFDWPAERLAALDEPRLPREFAAAERLAPGARRLRPWEPQTSAYLPGPDGEWARRPVPDLWYHPVTEDGLYLGRGNGRMVLVTTIGPDGVVDHPVGADAPFVFALGPPLAELAAEHPPVPLTPSLHCAHGGLLVDPARREIHYWTGHAEPSWLPEVFAAAWSGWAVRRNDAGVTGHFTLTGRDSAPVRIDPAVVRRYLVRTMFHVDSHRGIEELVARIAERAARPGVSVAPGALRAPRPNLDPAAQQARLAALLTLLDG
jgi:hypothetical protein